MNDKIYVIAHISRYTSGHGESETSVNVNTDAGYFHSHKAAEAYAERLLLSDIITLQRNYSDNDL